MTTAGIATGWATYLRVSDEDKQTPERSFAMQRQRIEEHLLTPSDVPFSREYTDLLSGTNPNRKDYQQMISDAEKGKFSHLGLYRADRFGRNTVEGLQTATKLMSLGIKIRVASMPSLRPESPDGFFMFLIQMGMAQREVDVMRQRTRDGTEAKLRAGGWSSQAPEGYCNKERQIKSGKYERWVEPDPKYFEPLREAWDMLLTDRYTLDQICEELTSRGYIRRSGSPWAWTSAKTNRRKTAKSKLHFVFNNPFYAGWIVSEPFNIQYGEIRGNWKPLVTTDEYEKGVAILKKHGANKSRLKRKHYLLRGLLFADVNDRQYKIYGSTPSGRKQSYSYYITSAKPQGKAMRVKTNMVDDQIPDLLDRITIEPDLVPRIRELYRDEIKEVTEDDSGEQLEKLSKQLTGLKDEEARLARLFMGNNINEETYIQLRQEWLEKTQKLQQKIKELKIETSCYLDDLEMALMLISNLVTLFDRLEDKQKTNLLANIFKKIIVNREGDIISYELHSPFTYLISLASQFSSSKNEEGSGSRRVQQRPQTVWHQSNGFFFVGI